MHGRLASIYGATPKQRADALELMLAGVELVGTDVDARTRTGKAAKEHALTFYDASYLELALREPRSMLLTQDRGLLAAGKRALGDERASDLDGAAALLAEVE